MFSILSKPQSKASVSSVSPRTSPKSNPPEASASPPKGDQVELGGQTQSDTFARQAKELAQAAGRSVGHAGTKVGGKLLNVAGRLTKDTVLAGVAAALPAVVSASALFLGGPLVWLGSVAAIGAGTAIAHNAMAPPNPADKGLSAGAKSHNRMVDSVSVAALATCSAMMGIMNIPFPGAGVLMAGATGAIAGALGSVVNQAGEALGLITPSKEGN